MIKPNAILEIKTKNLIHNYKTLSTIASSSLAGATLKANAYGIGDLEIYKLLYKNNCRHFFFASLDILSLILGASTLIAINLSLKLRYILLRK